ncbi:serine/threonine protein kinase [Spirulina sp. 06S082]|uniref:serine/threonine protein kinase n=1 Tax=Spirulina sp. 06S082 TaxID=3110248 RepID=UPI002B21BEB3|nr:protein kinase [Spirulina sp. 06S082]MEA5467321.1 protein kinase [Spirulina sp. 06S082]
MTISLLNNRYRIVKNLGKGGFGQTFLAVDTHLPSQRQCVIKQLKPSVPVPPEQQQWLEDRFQREAAILEALGEEHPQIPQLYAYFSEGGEFFLVQEWIAGVTLTQAVRQNGVLSADRLRPLLVELLGILDYIHAQKMLHRDIKPDNIILRGDRKPVLIDFGAVKETMGTTVHTSGNATSVAIGTPGFMPSEQSMGRPLYSSDVYALGLTAIFALSGKMPYGLETDAETGEWLWQKSVPSLPSDLTEVIDRAIRYHPRDRFSTAKAMLEALGNPILAQPTQLPATQAVSPVSGSSLSMAKTVAVSPGENEQTTPVATSATVAVPSPRRSPKKGILLPIAVGLFATGGVAIAALFFGFSLFQPRSTSDRPFGTADTDFPTPIETPSPILSPTPKPSPTSQPSPTPSPIASPSPTPQPSPRPSPTPKPPSTPTNNNALNVPIFPTGTSKSAIVNQLGQPRSDRQGFWPGTRMISYSQPDRVRLNYLFESDTGKLRQTEVSLPLSVEYRSMEKTLTKLLNGQTNPAATQSLKDAYNGASLRSFTAGSFSGMIRHKGDRLEIEVRDVDFRP